MVCQATPERASGPSAAEAVLRSSPAEGQIRVLLPTPGVESFDHYLASGGYRQVVDPADVVSWATAAGISGRGGAGFPLARKLAAVAGSADAHRVVVANGEEGEPGSVKDRTLMRCRPHLVLDGLRLAGLAVGASELHVFVSDPLSAKAMAHAAAQAPPMPPVTVTTVGAAYVAGEESAVVRYLDGGPALPTAKPPRVFEVGVGGHPTVVSNVETLANLALVATHGPDAYDRGTVLVTVSGDAHASVLVEAPWGTRLRDVVDTSDVVGVLCGGLFGGLQHPAVLNLPLDHAVMRESGTAMGCGAFHLLSSRGCPVELVTDAVSYLGRQSSQQCGSCFKGTAAMATTLRSLTRGEADAAALEPLARWSTQLVGRGNCALLDAACSLVGSLLNHWPEAVAQHLAGPGCEVCLARADGFAVTRLAVAMPAPELETALPISPHTL